MRNPFRREPQRHRCLLWKPQPDITTYELAQALGVFHANKTRWMDQWNVYDKLPPEVQRHFEVVSD